MVFGEWQDETCTFGVFPSSPQLLHGDVLVLAVQVAVLVGLLLLHVFYDELAKTRGVRGLPRITHFILRTHKFIIVLLVLNAEILSAHLIPTVEMDGGSA